jgi:predicted transcriptional regulator
MAASNRGGGVTDDEILAVLEQRQEPFATTASIQKHTGLSDQGVRNRLEELEKDGEIRRAKVGRHWVYWLRDYSYSGSR